LSNIKDDFLKRIYKSTAATDSITIAFPAVQSVDCCYIGLTNSVTATLYLYNSGGLLVSTKTIDTETSGGCFARVDFVSYAIITLAGTENIYVGNVGIGLTYKMPNPNNNIIKSHVDNSTTYSSDDGQYSINKIAWLKKVELSFFVLGMDLYNEIYALFSLIQTPVWVDIYEELNNGINPTYSQLQFEEDAQTMRKYTFKCTMTEAR
jgi:hypothetical protein